MEEERGKGRREDRNRINDELKSGGSELKNSFPPDFYITENLSYKKYLKLRRNLL